jgi:uncharacterized coiled-coil DUF342 family protein
MLKEERDKLIKELDVLKLKRNECTDFSEAIEIADKIHNIEMKLNGTRPSDSYVECIGCGS